MVCPDTRPARGFPLLLLVLLLAGVFRMPSPGQPLVSAALTNDLNLRLWDYSFDLRGGLGYKDNVLLGHTNRQASPFWDSGGDALVFRVPTSGWLFNGFLSADDVRYFGSKAALAEDFLLAGVKLTRPVDEHWQSTLGANYAYLNAVVDLTSLEPGLAGAQPIVENTFTGLWSVRGEYGPNWAELQLTGARNLMQHPLDSYWSFGPKLSLSHRFHESADLTLSYELSAMLYDTQPEVDSRGNPIAGTTLSRLSHAVQLSGHRVWDQAGHWHTTLTASLNAYQDSGSGYFNYTQYALTPKLEYRAGAWKLSASVRGSWFNYPFQTIDAAGLVLRTKTGLAASLHIDRNISKALKLTAHYDFDSSFSNLDIDDYYAHTFMVGAEWRF